MHQMKKKFFFFGVSVFFTVALRGQTLQFFQTNIFAANSASVLFDMAASKTDNSLYGCGYTASYNTSLPLQNGPLMALIFKKDENGNTLWSWTNTTNISVSGAGCYAYSITTGAADNIYVAGRYTMSAAGQTITIGNIPMPFGNGYFVIKFDASGNILWVQAAGGSVLFNSIDTDNDNNLYVLGSVRGTSTFGNTTVNSSSGLWKDCIVKYDAGGGVQWVKELGEINLNNTTVSDRGALLHIAVKKGVQKQLFLAGYFLSPYTIDGQTFTSTGAEDALLVKLDENGNLLASKQEGGPNADSFQDIAINQAGELALPLLYKTSTIVNGQTFSTTPNTLHSVIVKLNSSFTYQWVQPGLPGSWFRTGIENTGRVVFLNGLGFSAGGTTFTFLRLFAPGGSLLFSKDVSGTASSFVSHFLPMRVIFTASGESLYFGARYKPNSTIDGITITCSKNFNHEVAVGKITLPQTGLPLQLLSFIVKEHNTAITKLEWKTTDEINTLHFELERSNDGRRFFSRALVKANNKPGMNEYQSNDIMPLTGESFYRLKMVDIDGKYTYSQIIKIKNMLGGMLVTFPSPARNLLNIRGKGIQKLVVTDISGKILREILLADNVSSIDVSAFPQGIYLLRAENGMVVKWIKE